jgi:hypothetical protein
VGRVRAGPVGWAAEWAEVAEDTSRPGDLLAGATEKAIGQFLNAWDR